ncbi:UvrD-helicase domain-containing protein [Curtobacterium sp. MCBD17_040]|uniref:UvrD-helicase domain-containing protein n=1 Tax=Curtobacterium sp. MCBD17_040 TaxID=2175674 RepID=UPI000DA95F60|nr:UvrD-helicase domain-containing protein [Curtobacterium sp. MCBD17_040]WIB65681.1 UvrD-helicase domain-containing protein [Curtobacterium sp. MCBD17_040]
MSFAPTAEQQAAVDGFLTGKNLTIAAGAGTGKTSTLRYIADAAGDRQGLYIAFNKSVQEEAARKFQGTAVRPRTAHSLAYASMPDELRHKLQQKSRMPQRDQQEALGLRLDIRVGEERVRKHVVMRLVRETLEKFCRTAAESIDASMVPPLLTLNEVQNAELAQTVFRYAQKYWYDVLNPDGALPFKHDYYLKLWQLSQPTLPYDFILLDEAQDSDPLLVDVLHRQVNTQLVAVGDRSQAIYGWRGATDSMDAFGGETFQLTQSFRFGHAIAEEANVWLDLLDADLRIRGSEKDSSVHASYVRVANGVLCRTNAGAIAEVIDAHQRTDRDGSKITVGIASEARAKQMRELANAAMQLQERGYTSHPELDAFDSWEAVQEYATEDDGADLAPLVRLVDDYGADKIVAAIDACVPAVEARSTISTVHVAKGLEWKHVRIAEDFPIPGVDDSGELEQMTPEAMMLAYVAVTRAQRHLDPAGLDWARGYRQALRRPEHAATWAQNAQKHRYIEMQRRKDSVSDPDAVGRMKGVKSSGGGWNRGGNAGGSRGSWSGRRAS